MNVSLATSLQSAMKEGEVIARRDRAAHLWKLPDGCVVKQFRIKPFFSSATLRPPAFRFARAARQLERRGIPTVRIERVIHEFWPQRDLVVYRPLEGETLRDWLARLSGNDQQRLTERFAAFAATLHERGVYFRAIHFGNVIVTPDDAFGLIDIADCRFRPGRLNLRLRARNFRPMTSYPEDRAALRACGVARWIRAYSAGTPLKPSHVEWLQSRLAESLGES